jgi:hypothetical protein
MPPAGEPPMSAARLDSKMGGPMQEVAPTVASGAASAVSSASPRPGMAGVAADALLEPWFSCLQERLGRLPIFDCHTHLGCAGPDGSCFGVDELRGALASVDGRAVVSRSPNPMAIARPTTGCSLRPRPRTAGWSPSAVSTRGTTRSGRPGARSLAARRGSSCIPARSGWAGRSGGPADLHLRRRAPAPDHRARRARDPVAGSEAGRRRFVDGAAPDRCRALTSILGTC